jgi:hypothetical protein
VERIHNNDARKPSVSFNAVARAIFYKGCDENDDPSLTAGRENLVANDELRGRGRAESRAKPEAGANLKG